MKPLNTLNRHFSSLGKNSRCLSLLVVIGVAAIVFTSSAIAAAHIENLGQRTITGIGCHNYNNTCFIALDGVEFGADQGCTNASNQVRWDNGNTSEGKRAYSTLLTAYMTGKKANITIYGCNYQSFPTITWYWIIN